MASFSKPLKPAAFIGRYKRYKAGTKQVIEWLARTADRVGDLRSCLDCLKPKADGSKLSKADIETIRIKTHELKKLAALIADSDPPVGVPRDLLRVLEDVIAGRQACARWYASQAIGDVTELARQNDSHAHFILVLKQVQDILRPRETDEAPQEPSRPVVAGAAAEKPNNIFSVLDFEEARGADSESEDLPSHLPRVKKARKPKKKANVTQAHKIAEKVPLETAGTGEYRVDPPPPYIASVFELEQSDESDAFALWCHLADLNDIRTSVRDTWGEFSQGKITLDVAGVITETAFGMMKQAHGEFIAFKPRFKAWWSLSLFLGLKTAYNNNVVYTFSKDPLAKAADAQSEMKQADLVCAAASLLLRVFREACQQSLAGALKYKKSFWDQLYPTGLIGGRPKTDFEAHLFSFVPEITAVAAFDRIRRNDAERQPHYHSHFIEELTTLLPLNSEPVEPPIWLVVATQTCMDMNDSFDVASFPAVLRKTALQTKNVMQQYMESPRQPQFAHAEESAVGKKYLERMLGQWAAIESAITPAKLGDKESFGGRLFYPGLRDLPHLGGEISYSMKIRMHAFGTKVANGCNAIVIMAHLYKAARKYDLGVEIWQDLEMVIANHSIIAKTKSNTDAYAMVRRFLLDMGIAVPNSLPNKMPSTAFSGTAKKLIAEADPGLVASMIDQCRDWDLAKTKTSTAVTLQAVLTGLAAKSKGSNSEQRSWFSPTELLSTLKQELIASEARVNFDYVSFSRLCLSLLKEFINAGMSKAPKTDRHEDGPAAVYYLLKGVADVDNGSNGNGLLSTIFGKKLEQIIADTPFAAGAAVLKDALKDGHGKTYCQAAFDQSSGRLRKESRPAAAPRPERVISETAIEAFMELLGPGVSCASSRRTIEIYDPTGCVEKMDWMFNTRDMAPITGALMPDGISKDVKIIVPAHIEDVEDFTDGFSRPNLKFQNDPCWGDPNRSDDYVSYEEAMEMERKAKDQAGMPGMRKN